MYDIQPKTSSQKITGSIVSVQQVVTVAAPLNLHTCPIGRIQEIHLVAGVLVWGGAGRNLRFRVAGFKVIELNDVGTPLPPFYQDLGVFTLQDGQTLTVTTQNVGTEGGTAIYTAAINKDVPL